MSKNGKFVNKSPNVFPIVQVENYKRVRESQEETT